MTSSELRSFIGQLRLNNINGQLSDQQLTEQYQQIDFSTIIDNDGNLINLQNIVNEWLNQL